MSADKAEGKQTVTGIVEAALYVKDVLAASAFYRELFGFEEEITNEQISVLRVPGRQALILFPQASVATSGGVTPPNAIDGIIPPHGGAGGRLHVAFSIRPEDLQPWRERLTSRAIRIEGVVRWKRGGTSLYFRDLDEHLIELITPGLWSFY